MKRLLLLAGWGIFCCFPGTGLTAFVHSSVDSLPDFDLRNRPVPTATAPASTALESESRLLNLIPSARVARDPLTSSPRHIAARGAFLTGPGGEGGAVSSAALAAVPVADPHRVVKAFLNEHATLFGHDGSVLEPGSARITRDSVARHNGLRTTVWEETAGGIPVFESLLISHVTGSGELVSVSGGFKIGSRRAPLAAPAPAIDASRAVVLAARSAGKALAFEPRVTVAPSGRELRQRLAADGLTGPAWTQLTWFPVPGEAPRLAWRVLLIPGGTFQRYLLLVDAHTGELLLRRNLARNATPASYSVFTGDSPTPFTPAWPEPSPEQPGAVDRETVKLASLDGTASPLGWIYDGATNTTFGNNADAFVDRDLDLVPDVPRPQAGAQRNFNPPLDLSGDPTAYQDASTVQLFYRANWFHDMLYQLGFDEASGNYQLTNFNRGGEEEDAVICLVQAGADVGFTDNSAFLPGPDGVPGVCLMFTFTFPEPDRDGSLDQEVVIHELAHGLTERLVGGGIGMSQLQSGGLGEGWSDFYALALLSEPDDDLFGNYPVGAYASYRFYGLQDNYYFGIRRYPYTTDLSKNPLTLKDIDPAVASAHRGIPINPIIGGSRADEVHNMGEVWCAALWDARAALIERLGFEDGNRLMLQLATDGLKLCPPNPSFLEARDAILEADQVLTGGSVYDDLWIAFARRGFGFSAVVPPSHTASGVREAYDTPPDVVVGIADGVLEIRVNPASTSVVFAGETNNLYVKITDGGAVTNATIDAVVDGKKLVFRNDGKTPDNFASDSTFSSQFVAPTNASTLTIPMVVTAPDKQPATNLVTYTVIPVPLNDAFARAVKTPQTGGEYLTSNKRASLEEDEPMHAGVATADASLWWNYNATASRRVLVDTGGSDVPTVVAVYTNTALASLRKVVSAVGSTTRKGAFVEFDAISGLSYKIAVAAVNPKTTGTFRLRVLPAGVPDTNAPSVAVTSPLSGLELGTNYVLVSGSAVDPGANASGIRYIAVSVSPAPGSGETVNLRVIPASFGGPGSTNWLTPIGLRPGRNLVRVSAVDYVGNLSRPVELELTYRGLEPPNDFLVNSTPFTNHTGVMTANTLTATREVGEPLHAENAGGKSAWWSFRAPADGTLQLSTTNSTFDTLLAVYAGESMTNLVLVGENDDAFTDAPGGFSRLSVAVRGGQSYRIAVDGYDGAGGAMFLEYTFAAGTVYHLATVAGPGGEVSPGSRDVAAGTAVTLRAEPEAYYEFVRWEGDAASTQNPLEWIVTRDARVSAVFRPVQFTDDFETGDFSRLPWTFGETQPWRVQTNSAAQRIYAARSGAIGHGQTSVLSLTERFQAGNVSFDLRVSSESSWDTLGFLVDGNLVQEWSGEVGWKPFAYPLAAGSHTLEWRYRKDTETSVGLDAAFIDSLQLPLASNSTNVVAPPVLSLSVQSDDSFLIEVGGQPSQPYVMERSADFVSWTSFATNASPSGKVFFIDRPPANSEVRFYRARVP